MNSSIYDFNKNPKAGTEEMESLMKCYKVIYDLLTEVQRERLFNNYNQYKEHEKDPIDFHLYCLRHLEFAVVK